MPAAARVGDKVMHDAPHCHAPHGPAGPIPHPPVPMEIDKGIDSVLIGGAKAAVVGSTVAKCAISCTPGGPGLVAMGSMTVLIGGQPAARANDPTMHPACAGPVPGLTGKIMPPCCPAVEIA